jgi:hypothetical protein
VRVRYFSVDGGVTNIVGFNQIPGLDFGDFGANIFGCPVPDAFIQDAFICPNQQRENYTTASPEYSMLLSIGYDPIAAAAVPEPGTLALLGTSLLGFGALRRRQWILAATKCFCGYLIRAVQTTPSSTA